jgi:peptide/nickel transport system ATP-binding protein
VTVLRAEGVSVSVTVQGTRHHVLRNLDFSLDAGRVLGIVGESGAGKSMIGRTVAQALPNGFAVSTGELRYGGENLASITPARRRALLGREIAFIPQEPMAALNPVLSIGQQFREHLRRLGMGDWRDRAAALLEAVHLRDARDLLARYPHQLSGGMCQRVLIAMAFASDPKLVIADEPTTALDVTVQAQILRLIREMQERVGTAVMFITHDLRLAGQICDDVLVLYAGRPVEIGPAHQVLARPSHPYTRCLQLSAPMMQAARRALFNLRGQMPGLREIAALPGCGFAPRCPVAQADCIHREPLLEDGVACFHADSAAMISVPSELPHAPPVQDGAVLDVHDLNCRFSTLGMFRRVVTVAASDISFTVGSGEFVGLVGESGSGKSTVARLVMGLVQPSSGDIILAGAPVPRSRSAARRMRLGAVQMVFQDPQSALNPRRRVADIITQPLRASSASEAVRGQRARELLSQVGLAPEIAQRYPAQLSGGQRQRVNIARALCILPKLLVADEIVSGLDVSVQAQLLDLLLQLRSEMGFAMLFISHDLAVVRYLCSRVLVMHRGVIVEQGETEAVFAAPQHPYTQQLLAAVPPDV